jgi:hypothetical protein
MEISGTKIVVNNIGFKLLICLFEFVFRFEDYVKPRSKTILTIFVMARNAIALFIYASVTGNDCITLFTEQ